MKKYIVFADICSSTKIIECLIQNGKEQLYSKLIADVVFCIKNTVHMMDYFIYKFLGDGFIILIDERVSADDIFFYMVHLGNILDKTISKFVKANVDIEIEKIGMSYGVSLGIIHELDHSIFDSVEYFGRPINLAARLQSSNEEANSILVQQEVYNRVSNGIIKKSFTETTRTFHNISNDVKMRCYKFKPNNFNTDDLGNIVYRYIDMKVKFTKEQKEKLNNEYLEYFNNYIRQNIKNG